MGHVLIDRKGGRACRTDRGPIICANHPITFHLRRDHLGAGDSSSSRRIKLDVVDALKAWLARHVP
jgi:hypothetical protein